MPATVSRGARATLVTAQALIAIGGALVGYSTGLARYDARVAVLETEVHELARQEQVTSEKMDRIADRIGAARAGVKPAALAALPFLPYVYPPERAPHADRD